MARAKPTEMLSLEEMSQEITKLSSRIAELETKPAIRVSREKVLEILYGVFLNGDSVPQDLRQAMANWMGTAVRNTLIGNRETIAATVTMLKTIATEHASAVISEAAINKRITEIVGLTPIDARRINGLNDHLRASIRSLASNGHLRITME